jgi:hypothetical protein
MNNNGVECAILVSTEEVVPSKQGQGKCSTRPRVHQKEQKVLQVVCSDTVIHPRAVVVHFANATIADPAMVRHGGLECLALTTHAMRILHETLAFARNSSQWHTSGVS